MFSQTILQQITRNHWTPVDGQRIVQTKVNHFCKSDGQIQIMCWEWLGGLADWQVADARAGRQGLASLQHGQAAWEGREGEHTMTGQDTVLHAGWTIT